MPLGSAAFAVPVLVPFRVPYLTPCPRRGTPLPFPSRASVPVDSWVPAPFPSGALLPPGALPLRGPSRAPLPARSPVPVPNPVPPPPAPLMPPGLGREAAASPLRSVNSVWTTLTCWGGQSLCVRPRGLRARAQAQGLVHQRFLARAYGSRFRPCRLARLGAPSSPLPSFPSPPVHVLGAGPAPHTTLHAGPDVVLPVLVCLHVLPIKLVAPPARAPRPAGPFPPPPPPPPPPPRCFRRSSKGDGNEWQYMASGTFVTQDPIAIAAVTSRPSGPGGNNLLLTRTGQGLCSISSQNLFFSPAGGAVDEEQTAVVLW